MIARGYLRCRHIENRDDRMMGKASTRSLTPASTPAHEARAGDPGSRAEDCARSLTGVRDDVSCLYVIFGAFADGDSG